MIVSSRRSRPQVLLNVLHRTDARGPAEDPAEIRRIGIAAQLRGLRDAAAAAEQQVLRIGDAQPATVFRRGLVKDPLEQTAEVRLRQAAQPRQLRELKVLLKVLVQIHAGGAHPVQIGAAGLRELLEQDVRQLVEHADAAFMVVGVPDRPVVDKPCEQLLEVNRMAELLAGQRRIELPPAQQLKVDRHVDEALRFAALRGVHAPLGDIQRLPLAHGEALSVRHDVRRAPLQHVDDPGKQAHPGVVLTAPPRRRYEMMGQHDSADHGVLHGILPPSPFLDTV